MFGESPVAILLSFESTKYPTIEDKMKTLLWNRQEALAAHELARSRMADQRRSTFTPFKKGDRVWLDPRNLKTIYHKKMKPKWEGPFVITEVLGLVTYRLILPTSWWIHNAFHATLLKPYRENEIYGENFIEPPPELVEGEEVYEVETIYNHREMGMRISILHPMAGLSYFHCLMGTRTCIFNDGKILAEYKIHHCL